MPDDETESYRVEQGRPPRPDPRDRQADVPLAFSTGGVLRSGADERADVPDDDDAGRTADATEAVERGAAAVAAERRAAADGGEGAAAGPDAAARPPASRRP